MKKIHLIFLVAILAFASCDKNEISPEKTPPDDTTNSDDEINTENSSVLWEYKTDYHGILLTDLVLDNNDNAYFFSRANDQYVLHSFDHDGALRWSKILAFGSYLYSRIMLAGDRLILSYQNDVIAAYDLNDGTQLWSTPLNVSFSDMAYNDGTIYVAQTTTVDTESQISAIAASDGTIKWYYSMDKHIESKLSVYKNAICVVSEDRLPWPFEIGLTILTDNGSSATKAWKFYQPRDVNPSEPIKPRRASFDGLGNIYYEESTTDTTYIHSYKVSNGQENWEKKLCNFGLPEPVILYGNGKITASYKSDESWAIVNSIITMDASTGNTVKQNDNIILNDSQVLLTGDYSTVVFNRLLDDLPTMQVYAYGDVMSTIKADYFGLSVLNFSDFRITSDGNLLLVGGAKIMCVKANLSPTTAGTWSCRKGTNANTNSINL